MVFGTTLLTAALVLILPGALVAWISGTRIPLALASGIPISMGVYGSAAWILGEMGIAYSRRSIAACYLAVLALAALWRLAADYRRGRRLRKHAALAQPPAAVNLAPYGAAPNAAPTPTSAGTTASTSPQNTPETTAGPVEIPATASPSEPVPTWRRWWARLRQPGSLANPEWILPGLGIAIAAWISTARAATLLDKTPGGLDNIYQGWDVHWHASVIEFITQTGIASPTKMGLLQNTETHHSLYYPSAWHATAWVLHAQNNLSTIAATNIAGFLIPSLTLPISVAYLAWVMVGRRGLTAQLAAAFAALLVPSVAVLIWIGLYVGMWPYLAAMCMTGIVVGLYASVPSHPRRAFAATLSFVGLVETHPAPASVVVMILLLWWLFSAAWRGSRRGLNTTDRLLVRLKDLGWLAGAGVAAVLLLLPQLLAGAGATEEVGAFTAFEAGTREQSWQKVLQLGTRHAGDFATPWLLLWAAAAGGILLLLWRRNLWAPIFVALSMFIAVNSLLPVDNTWGEWAGIIGGLHYNTAHRLIMPVAMMETAAAGAAIAIAIRLLSGAPFTYKRTTARRISGAISVALALIVGGTLLRPITDTMEEPSAFGMTAARDGRLVGGADTKAFQWLAAQPKAYQGAIFSNPAEGSGWMYPYNGLPAFFRHYLWPSTGEQSDTNALFWNADLLGRGNQGNPNQANWVDLAAKRQNITFIYVSPPSFWDFQLPNEALEDRLWDAPGVTPVYVDGPVRIFAVNNQFTDAEITAMRASGSPAPLPPVPTRGQAGVATSPADAAQPYYHRYTDQSATVLPNRNEPAPSADMMIDRTDALPKEELRELQKRDARKANELKEKTQDAEETPDSGKEVDRERADGKTAPAQS